MFIERGRKGHMRKKGESKHHKQPRSTPLEFTVALPSQSLPNAFSQALDLKILRSYEH
jgi:hypothetical protein